MHGDCFETWQESIINYLNKTREGQRKVRNWSDRQKLQNLWKPQGYNLVIEACGCKCNSGQLRKDLNWVPPKPGSGRVVHKMCKLIALVTFRTQQ